MSVLLPLVHSFSHNTMPCLPPFGGKAGSMPHFCILRLVFAYDQAGFLFFGYTDALCRSRYIHRSITKTSPSYSWHPELHLRPPSRTLASAGRLLCTRPALVLFFIITIHFSLYITKEALLWDMPLFLYFSPRELHVNCLGLRVFPVLPERVEAGIDCLVVKFFFDPQQPVIFADPVSP
jgi:hypothetical protein